MAKEFRIVKIQEITTKEGRKFNAFKTLDKNQRLMDVKFRRDCKNIPSKPCTIVVNEGDYNVDTTRLYPCLWVKNVAKIVENAAVGADNTALYFDVESTDDLPF